MSVCDPTRTENGSLLFIVNPKAGGSRHKDLPGFLEQQLKDYPHEILIPESADALKEALPAKLGSPTLSKVVIAGGDGTIMDLLPLLAEHPKVDVGILPLGTGNLLAQNLSIPIDLTEALKVVLNGRCQPIDLCRVNDRLFILNAGAGADADIMESAHQSKVKQHIGVWAYVVEGAKHVLFPRFAKFHIEADGHSIHARALGVICFNAGGQVGGGLTLVPNIAPDDGLLHGCIIRVDGVVGFLGGLFQILIGRRGRKRDPVQHFRAKKVKINARPGMTTQADGNVIGQTPLELEVLPRQLSFIVP